MEKLVDDAISINGIIDCLAYPEVGPGSIGINQVEYEPNSIRILDVYR